MVDLVEFGIVIVEFLVEELDYFLFLLHFVSQIMYLRLNVGFYHSAHLLSRVVLTALALLLVGRTVVSLGPHELVRTQTRMLRIIHRSIYQYPYFLFLTTCFLLLTTTFYHFVQTLLQHLPNILKPNKNLHKSDRIN